MPLTSSIDYSDTKKRLQW